MNIDINDGNQDMKAKIDEKEQAIQIKEARVIEAHYKIWDASPICYLLELILALKVF